MCQKTKGLLGCDMTPTIEEIKREVAWQLAGISPDTVKLFDRDKDDLLEENYTINFFPSEWPNVTVSQIDEIKKIDSELFFLERDKWHITFVGEIDTRADVEVIKKTMKEWKHKISFELNGFASNKTTASFLAYPNFDLHDFRQTIREGLGIGGTDYTVHLSIYEYIGWVNFVRYTSAPNVEFFDFLRKNKNLDLGNISEGKIKLLKNKSRTLRNGEYEVVAEF
jgi:hypothetical protein